MTEEKKLTPEQLTEVLAIAATELCWLGAKEDDPGLQKLERALTIVTQARGLSEAHLQQRIDLIRGEQAAIKKLLQGEQTESALPEERLRTPMGADEILPALAALKETRALAKSEQDKVQLHDLSRFLAKHWASGELEHREYDRVLLSL